MSPLKRSDVQNHLHPPFFTKIHLVQPESQPDATGFSVAESGAINTNPSGIVQDFLADHSSSPAALAPADHVTGSGSSQASAGSKSAKA